MEKPKYYVASFSGGKDSTAMVLHLIELGEQIDEVIFCDTTMEFPAMMRHVEKVKRVIEDAGVKFTTLRSVHDFEYWLLEYTPKRKNPDLVGLKGKSWAGPKTRWCTKHLKTELIEKYVRQLREKYDVIQYIGIAADEGYRLERSQQKGAQKRYPLTEWGWIEADALSYCYSKGYDWEGLYELFGRVSCWCCPLQPLEELRKLRKHFPELWERLWQLDNQTWRTFKSNNQSVENLDKRFSLEEKLIEHGQSITNRIFYADLKRLFEGEVTIEEIIQERGK